MSEHTHDTEDQSATAAQPADAAQSTTTAQSATTAQSTTAAQSATTAPEIDPHAKSLLTLANAMFRYALWPSLATIAIGAVVFGLINGSAGLFGALVGGLLAAASSLLTLLLMRKTAHLGPHIGMAASLGGFVGKLLVLLLVMTALRGVDALHAKSLGITMVAVVLVAAAAEAVAFRRTKLPTIIPAGEK